MSQNNINKLRIEKRLINSQLKAIQPKLSKGVRNTRKHQLDAQKVTDLTIRLSKIESDLFLEESKLNKLKSAKINIADSPLVQSMYKTPPKHILEAREEIDLNKTYIAPVTTEIQKNIEVPPEETITTISTLEVPADNSDFQNFVQNTVGLKGAVGGVIPKKPPTSTITSLAISTEIFSDLFSTKSFIPPRLSGDRTSVHQIYNRPITIGLPKKPIPGKNIRRTIVN